MEIDNTASNEQPAQQPQPEQQPAEQQQKVPVQEEKPDTRSFDELSPEEQQDMIKTSFFGEDYGEDSEYDDEKSEDEQPEQKPEDQSETEEETKTEKADGDQEESEKEEEKEDSAGEEDKGENSPLYSAEEFLSLSPETVNPDRLPQAARLVHNQYIKWFNQTIAPRMNALQQFYNNAQAQAQKQPQAQQTPHQDNFNAIAKAEAARRLGVKELDEFNPDHTIMLQRVVTEMQYRQDAQKYQQQMQQQQMQQQQEQMRQFCVNIVNDVKAEYKNDFEVIDAYAEKELRKLPVENFMQVMGDLRSGDAQRVKNVYKMFADRYYAQKKTAAAPQKKQVQAPPQVIGGSSDTGSTSPSWGVRDFAKADSQRKTEMLAERFFSNYK